MSVETRSLEGFLSKGGRVALVGACLYLSVLARNLYAKVDVYLDDVEFLLRVTLVFLVAAWGMRLLARLWNRREREFPGWKTLLWHWVYGLVIQILVSLLLLRAFSAGSLSQVFHRKLGLFPEGWGGAATAILLFEFLISATVVFGAAAFSDRERLPMLDRPTPILWAHTIALTLILTTTML